MSADRTPEQTALALFYTDNFFVQWERILRDIAGTNINNIGDSARLFALAYMAAADAFITAWDTRSSGLLLAPHHRHPGRGERRQSRNGRRPDLAPAPPHAALS